MRSNLFASMFASTLLLLGAPALAQMAPAAAHPPAAGPAAAGHPMPGGGGMMMGGGAGGDHGGGSMGHGGGMMMGGGDDDDCDSESCPMMGGGGGHGGHDGDGPRFGMLEHMADELGLSDAVRKKIKDMVYEAQKQSITLHADMEQAKLELHRMMDQDKPDTEAVIKLFDKVGQLKNELAKLHLRTMLEAQKLLTPEQRKKMHEHMMGMMMKMGGGKMGGGKMGMMGMMGGH